MLHPHHSVRRQRLHQIRSPFKIFSHKTMWDFKGCLRSMKPSSNFSNKKTQDNDVWHMAGEWRGTLTVGGTGLQ